MTILGSGLWGDVLDLKDGTVLKLSRRQCAGIGDGWLKIQREVSVLNAIESVGAQTEIVFAKVSGWGKRLPQDLPLGDNRDLWLRMTKVPGQKKTVAVLNTLSKNERNAISKSIATTLLELHRSLQLSTSSLHLPTAEESLLMIREEIQGTPEATEGIPYIMRLLTALNKMQSVSSPVIHGDFNISNILFCDSDVSAVVDFAETRQGFYEEDIAAVVDELPEYRLQIIKAFESAADCLVSEQKLSYGLAVRALLSFLIGCRLRPEYDHSEARRQLEQRINCLLDCV